MSDFKNLSIDKRNAYLVISVVPTETLEPFHICGTYKKVTKAELPFKIMEDRSLGDLYCCNVFRDLLLYRRNLLVGEIFKRVRHEADTNWKRHMTGLMSQIDPSFIKHLYTEILTPEDLIKDIESIDKLDEFAYKYSYIICFEDEDSWKSIVSQLDEFDLDDLDE